MATAQPTLLLNGKPPQAGLELRLAESYTLHRLHEKPDANAFLSAHGAEIDGIVAPAPVGASAALIEALPNLRVIAGFGVGFDQVDQSAALRRGVKVSNTPDVLNECVADHAFALLLDVARGVAASDRFVRRGDWLKGRFPLGMRVSGKKLGVLGLGRIGRAVAQRASGFGMEVGYCNRRPADDVPYAWHGTPVELARWCDFVVITAAGGDSTRHLVGREAIDALGPRGVLVNVARGSVVDEVALIEALQERRIAGAGLDVYEREPHVAAGLRVLDNVVLTPHIASGTEETRAAMADLVVDNLSSFFTSGRLITPVPWSPA
ncbi:2-hydroxyacid dehydrogenase [Ideonella sp. YS5]|uniref:2-hydroxyacid dehydrogenase n=1 Tax=Ideonella sp. YS5 TaxID=3453714 RepID=UPI003EEDAE5D